MRLISWNVNGIRSAAKKDLLGFISEQSPDIISLQETKANEDQLTSQIRHPKGYFSYFSSAEKKGYSGVCTFSKIEPLEIEHGFGVTEFDSEGRILRLKYPEFYLFNIYFPNGSASIQRLEYKMNFYKECLRQITKLRDDGENVIVCGDVNTAHTEADIARPLENSNNSGFLPCERKWMDDLVNAGFVDTFRIFNHDAGNYTWWSMKTAARDRNVGWRLDYFFVNEEFAGSVKNAGIMKDVFGSDHCPIFIDL